MSITLNFYNMTDLLIDGEDLNLKRYLNENHEISK